jgi:hypothetical protein
VLRGTAARVFVRDLTPEQLEQTREIKTATLKKRSPSSMPAGAAF